MRPLLFLLAFAILTPTINAGLFNFRRRPCPPAVTYVQPDTQASESTQFRRQPNCPDGLCPRQTPQPQPLPKFDIDFDDEPEAAPAPEQIQAADSGGLSKLDAIIMLITTIVGAISAFVATREDDDEDKEEDQQPPAKEPTGG